MIAGRTRIFFSVSVMSDRWGHDDQFPDGCDVQKNRFFWGWGNMWEVSGIMHLGRFFEEGDKKLGNQVRLVTCKKDLIDVRFNSSRVR